MAIKAIKLNPSVEPVPQHLLDKHYKRKHGTSAYYGQAAGLDSDAPEGSD
jgi:L-ribulose-5-phosphate 4-epimerase